MNIALRSECLKVRRKTSPIPGWKSLGPRNPVDNTGGTPRSVGGVNMKVSRNSWHSRLVRWYEPSYRPHDLCGYFWHVVLAILFSPFVITMIGAVAVLAAPFILLWKGGGWTRHRFNKRGYLRAKPYVRVAHDPSLLMAWLRAKKGKYCPLIELDEWEGAP